MAYCRNLVALLSLGSALAYLSPAALANAGLATCQNKLEQSGFDVSDSINSERQGRHAYLFNAIGIGDHPVWGRGNFSWQIYTDANCNILEMIDNV